jgi:pilus assembly protein CpaD
MVRSKSLAALIAIGVTFTAAAADARPRERHGPETGLDSLAQPVVRRTDFVLDLAAQDQGLSAAERGRLRAWFTSLDLGYGDRVWIDDSQWVGPAGEDVARVAAEYGLLLSDGGPLTTGRIEPGTVRVIVSRSTASVPGCPRADATRGLSTTSPNYGCAINSNLAAMIADPSDLVLGQEGGVRAGSMTGSKAIKVYRETPPTGTKGLSATSSKGGN